MSAAPVIGSTLGQIFQPLFKAMAWLIAGFYDIVPNYAVAIALLTLAVMIVTAPLTIKSTRSMSAMQRLAPEMKKLQVKYKGDKQTLNEEMMKLYKEHGVNPAGGCLPMIIQFPFFIILYDVIRGLTNTVNHGQAVTVDSLGHTLERCASAVCAAPRYIGQSTSLYKSLVSHHGKMPAFGIDLASKMLQHHSVLQALPYAFLILTAIGLGYFQMKRLNSRNPQAARANPQAQMMQRYMPLLFAVIYINIAAGVNIYFIVSNLCRIGIQEVVFRSGMLDKPVATEEVLPGRRSSAAPKRRSLMDRLADAQKRALEQQAQQQALRAEIESQSGSGSEPGSESESGAGNGPVRGPAASVPNKDISARGRNPSDKDSPGRSQPPSSKGPDPADDAGRRSPQPGASPSGSNGNGAPPKSAGQSRSKAKRDRKAR